MNNNYMEYLNEGIVLYQLNDNDTILIVNCYKDTLAKLSLATAWNTKDCFAWSLDKVNDIEVTGKKRRVLTITMQQEYEELTLK